MAVGIGVSNAILLVSFANDLRLEQHLGPEQMAVLRALKAHFDPDDIMNPGGTLGLDQGARKQ